MKQLIMKRGWHLAINGFTTKGFLYWNRPVIVINKPYSKLTKQEDGWGCYEEDQLTIAWRL